jgi:uncharacterized protein (TIGR02147 family)
MLRAMRRSCPARDQLLLRLGLVRRRQDGRYELADKTITAGPEVVNLGLNAFQRAMNELAGRATAELPPNQRHTSGATLGISRPTYEKICAEIDSFRQRLLALAEQDQNADNAYQLTVNLFPVSDVTGHLSGVRRRAGQAARATSSTRR